MALSKVRSDIAEASGEGSTTVVVVVVVVVNASLSPFLNVNRLYSLVGNSVGLSYSWSWSEVRIPAMAL